jgi:hypothetical protein
MGHNGCLIFCQVTGDEERRVSRRTVVMQHPSLVYFTCRIISIQWFVGPKIIMHLDLYCRIMQLCTGPHASLHTTRTDLSYAHTTVLIEIITQCERDIGTDVSQ